MVGGIDGHAGAAMGAEPLGGPAAFGWARSALAVCAHPDDESCGLGALLSLAVSLGTHVTLLTFTRGEAGIPPGWSEGAERLAAVRSHELERAARIIGIQRTIVLDYPDGGLQSVGTEVLEREYRAAIGRYSPDVVLAYDPLGVTCHPDHMAVGEAVLRAARDLPSPPALLFWTIPEQVAARMSASLGGCYAGRPAEELIAVDVGPFRAQQRLALTAHETQASDCGPQFSFRTELCGPLDHITLPSLWQQTGGRSEDRARGARVS